MRSNLSLSNPQAIAETGERIYQDKYRGELEKSHAGRFVPIDVLTEQAYVADLPEEALERARSASPTGLFHLIRIGSPGAFRMSSLSDDAGDRLFR